LFHSSLLYNTLQLRLRSSLVGISISYGSGCFEWARFQFALDVRKNHCKFSTRKGLFRVPFKFAQVKNGGERESIKCGWISRANQTVNKWKSRRRADIERLNNLTASRLQIGANARITVPQGSFPRFPAIVKPKTAHFAVVVAQCACGQGQVSRFSRA
jgi:hypothetical protein